ncbi:MAG: Ldh family oxidoreductase [Alphaproteobacteria bacterium]|nr:Ldh family oxidoreductase [Alphaproteobacteria bacterium]
MIEDVEHVRVGRDTLQAFVRTLISQAGADDAGAEAVTRAVMEASSRGVDTHGVRLLPHYVATVAGGRVNGKAKPSFHAAGSAGGHVDGDNGFGHLASYRAIEEGIRLARTTGVAAIGVRNSSHHGATGCYTIAAARQGFVAMGMTHADAIVVPYHGTKAFFGTNPLSFAVPVPGAEPSVIDMASSAVPMNRVWLWGANGAALPADIAVDAQGEPTRDAAQTKALLPVGGPDYGYKGTCLAMMIDLLCAGLTGMRYGAELPYFGGPDFSTPIPMGHFFVVFNPALFAADGHFERTAQAMIAALRAQPARPGEQVLAPGDPELQETEARRRDGIPVDRATWTTFGTLGSQYGCQLPPTLG